MIYMKSCPTCRGRVAVSVLHSPLHLLTDPPHRTARYLRQVSWQCMATESHKGSARDYVDDPDDEPVRLR
jgi:hypothetical protein